MSAGAKEAVSEGSPQPAKKGGPLKLLIPAAIGAVLALGGAGGGYFYARKAPDHVAPSVPDKVVRKVMVYLPMETFTVNLRDGDQERYLQATINLEVAEAKIADSLKEQMPSIRNRVLLLLSSKGAEDLMKREGKEKLATEIAEELRKTLEGTSPSKGLEQVLFSHFVIQ